MATDMDNDKLNELWFGEIHYPYDMELARGAKKVKKVGSGGSGTVFQVPSFQKILLMIKMQTQSHGNQCFVCTNSSINELTCFLSCKEDSSNYR